MLSAFRVLLEAHLRALGASLAPWPLRGRQVPNVVRVRIADREVLLYVKVSSSPRGFWGLTANRIEQLNRSGLWLAVLLHGKPTSGYYVRQAEALARISDGTLRLGADGDYKVNQVGNNLPGHPFESIEALVRDLAGGPM